MKLNKLHMTALEDVRVYSTGRYARGYPEGWKAKSVGKLLDLGLVERRDGERPYWITPKGLGALREAAE